MGGGVVVPVRGREDARAAQLHPPRRRDVPVRAGVEGRERLALARAFEREGDEDRFGRGEARVGGLGGGGRVRGEGEGDGAVVAGARGGGVGQVVLG